MLIRTNCNTEYVARFPSDEQIPNRKETKLQKCLNAVWADAPLDHWKEWLLVFVQMHEKSRLSLLRFVHGRCLPPVACPSLRTLAQHRTRHRVSCECAKNLRHRGEVKLATRWLGRFKCMHKLLVSAETAVESFACNFLFFIIFSSSSFGHIRSISQLYLETQTHTPAHNNTHCSARDERVEAFCSRMNFTETVLLKLCIRRIRKIWSLFGWWLRPPPLLLNRFVHNFNQKRTQHIPFYYFIILI